MDIPAQTLVHTSSPRVGVPGLLVALWMVVRAWARQPARRARPVLPARGAGAVVPRRDLSGPPDAAQRRRRPRRETDRTQRR